MGRLFWKFFFAFWLTLLIASVGVGTAVWLHRQTLEDRDRALAGGPRTLFLVGAAAATLRHGGIGALRELLDEWNRQGDTSVYVVNDARQELFDRAVQPEALVQADRLAREDREPRVARLETANQRQYLLFVPAESEAAPHGPPPSPWVPISIGILASLGFSALLAWYLSKPIRHLRGAFDAAAAGKLETRIGSTWDGGATKFPILAGISTTWPGNCKFCSAPSDACCTMCRTRSVHHWRGCKPPSV